MNISVIGLGKLGLCTAVCLAQKGHNVVGVDKDAALIQKLGRKKMPFVEKNLQNTFEQAWQHIEFTTHIKDALAKTDISFVIVPTPSLPDGSFSNQVVCQVLKDIGQFLKKQTRYHLVNIVSTVMPGTCQRELIPLLESASTKQVGKDFGFTYNPEFVAVGNVISDYLNPDLVLIGQVDSKAGDLLKQVYQSVCENNPHIAVTNLINAEMAKLSLNCFCTMKISFANNLANICESIPGADAAVISKIIGNDKRIGARYILPGLGFGGPCFPRDNQAFIRFIEAMDGYTGLQQAVVDINRNQIGFYLKKIMAAVEACGPRVALLGLAYKPFTYVTEDSQALEIAERISKKHSHVDLQVFDPLAKNINGLNMADSLESCVKDANVAAVLTPWPEFLSQKTWQHLLASQHCILNFWKSV